MKYTWEVDSENTVDANVGAFGKKVFTVNDRVVERLDKSGPKNQIRFALPDGRAALISIEHSFLTAPEFNLHVDGEMVRPNSKTPITCSGCGATTKPYDRFCEQCGQTMPDAADLIHQKRVKAATGAIATLAVLFVLFGTVMFFVSKSQSADTLTKLHSMPPTMTLPTPINGVTYTVAALTHAIVWEIWSVLIVNLILAAVMTGLFFWGKRAPLAAVLVATATYAVVIVTNLIIDPRTMAQGIYVKLMIVAILVKGIKSALALRTENV